MSGDIVTTNEQQPTAANVLALIARAANDPQVDVAKMAALLSLQERVMDRQAEAEFNAAYIALQTELPTISKKGAITNKEGKVQSRYAKWDDIYRVVMPLLRRFGFALGFEIGTGDGLTTVEAILSHSGGHVRKSGAMKLPTDASGAKNATQGVGSSVSYGKRYTTCAILNILTEDEDNDGRTRSERAEAFDTLTADATASADEGIGAYEHYFRALDKESQRTLVDSGKHAELKKRAERAGQ